jgi:hypothetical protein
MSSIQNGITVREETIEYCKEENSRTLEKTLQKAYHKMMGFGQKQMGCMPARMQLSS